MISLAGSAADPGSILLNGGALGVICFLFITDKIVTSKAVKREQDRADKAEAFLATEREASSALRERLDDRLIPALIRLLDATSHLPPLGKEDKPQP